MLCPPALLDTMASPELRLARICRQLGTAEHHQHHQPRPSASGGSRALRIGVVAFIHETNSESRPPPCCLLMTSPAAIQSCP